MCRDKRECQYIKVTAQSSGGKAVLMPAGQSAVAWVWNGVRLTRRKMSRKISCRGIYVRIERCISCKPPGWIFVFNPKLVSCFGCRSRTDLPFIEFAAPPCRCRRGMPLFLHFDELSLSGEVQPGHEMSCDGRDVEPRHFACSAFRRQVFSVPKDIVTRIGK